MASWDSQEIGACLAILERRVNQDLGETKVKMATKVLMAAQAPGETPASAAHQGPPHTPHIHPSPKA